MIIDDVNEQTTLKASTPAPHAPFEPGFSPSPPPYISYQTITPPALLVAPRLKSRSKKHHRFRRKYLVGASFVLNCLLVVLLIRVIRRVDEGESGRSEDDGIGLEIPDKKHKHHVIQPVVPNARLGRCIRNATWSNATHLPTNEHFTFSSNASFQFPNSPSLMFLLSQGALSGGDLHIIPSSEPVPYVVLNVRYHSLHVRDRANVCWMERKHDSGAGIGVFTPAAFDGQQPTDRLDFSITLFLPTRDSSSTSLPIYNLETDLPSFTHTLGSLRGVLEFDHLALRSKNKPILVQSMFAKNATIQTSNGHIFGSFDASSSLSLVTSNAPIDATVTLHSKNIFTTTDLVLQTRNAALDSSVSLLTSSASGQGGKFAVTAETSDGPLVMSFPASPTHSTLNLDARTSNSPANVWLNQAFEGEFLLASNMVFVDRRPFLDPTKLRSVFYSDYQNGMVTGNVQWKLPIFKSKTKGSVRVTTTNHILKFYV